MDRGNPRPFLALLLVQFSFASLAVVGKIVLGSLPAILVAGIRMFFASLFLSALALATQQEHPRRADLVKLFGLALLGIVFNQILFLEGLARSTAVNASILVATIPVFTTGIAILLGRESARPVRLGGIGVALVGALVVLDVTRFSLSDQYTFGNLLIVINCLSYSFYLVLSRPLLHRYRSTTVVAWTFLYGALLITPVAGASLAELDLSTIPAIAWWGMIWIVLIPSVLSYSLQNYALKRIRSSTVATYAFLQPLIGVGLAVLVIPAETVTLHNALGGLLIIAGVILVSRTETYEPVPAIPESGEAMSREPIAETSAGTQPEPQEDDRRGGRQKTS